MCKHDVTNIQHIIVNMHDIRYDMDCSLVGLDCETCPPITLKRVVLCTIYSQAKGCVCAGLQPGGKVAVYGICKYDVMHKAGNR